MTNPDENSKMFTDDAGNDFVMEEEPTFLTGYLQGLASRLGGDDAPILEAAAKYIEAHAPRIGPVTDFKPFVDYPWTAEEEAVWDKMKPTSPI